jgi:type I site-specific restriction endonuclease
MTNEAFARVKIDQLLKDADWALTDGRSVRFEYPLDGGGKADYALFDRQGRALAVLEAKSTSVDLSTGEAQGRRYADQLGVPMIFLSNGEEIWFCDKEQDAHFRRVETVFSQDDLARRKALVHGYRRGGILSGVGQMFTVAITGVCRAVQVKFQGPSSHSSSAASGDELAGL